MRQSLSPKRPWLAAVLGVLATGFGHLYLGRWKRALGWLAVLFGTAVLVVDPAALEALANLTVVDPLAVAPLLVVGALSVVDAYFLAHFHNAVVRRTAGPDGQLTDCPACGKELDPDLEFCHWCTTDLGGADAALPDDPADRDGS